MILLVQGVALILILTTLLPLSRTHLWWIRIFDYPRAQIAAGLIVVTALLLASGGGTPASRVLAAGAALAALYQLAQIVRYTPLWAVQTLEAERPPEDARVRILLANVLMHNRDAERLLRLVEAERPDLFLAVETDDWWDERLRPLADRMPHTCHEPLPNTYGLHFFSCLEVRDVLIRHLVEPDIPSVRADVRLRSGDWIEFIGVHPKPPDINQDVAERDAELVLVGREADAAERPVIVAGDLNDVAWSHTTRLFQRISGLLDPRVGRGLYSTFPAHLPFLRWPLDHLFHDRHFTLVELRRLPDVGSDHFPVLIELALQPEVGGAVEIPRPEPGDHREARRKIGLVLPKLRARAHEFRRRHPRLGLPRRRGRRRSSRGAQ